MLAISSITIGISLKSSVLQKAASRGGGFALAQARSQLPRALKAEGLI
jgi:hypothetical protein